MCFISARAGETNHKLILGSVLLFFVVFLLHSLLASERDTLRSVQSSIAIYIYILYVCYFCLLTLSDSYNL